ncbi:hypothetical protein [Salarchaeum sp. JOR-1]|uniref:hypothetical protein n=1 Tax=Salarchaeum sp. JOR-1 TaxID=2599399 RepID=UPI0011988DDC|nr:hypothetical protein [Salarchaeum sp. JOR-1]QDX40252.1 hypothetical protein FQU85_04825 [Salarchaeum sp. JOR-1]
MKSAITWEQSIGIDVSYYGTFSNPNKSDANNLHEFTISGYGGARKNDKGEWIKNGDIAGQDILIENHESTSMFLPNGGGTSLGVSPAPSDAEPASYVDTVEIAINAILSELNPYYGYLVTAADLVSSLQDPGDSPAGSSISMGWDHVSGSINRTGVSDTSNYLQIYVEDPDEVGGITATESLDTFPGSVSTSLDITVDQGAVVIANDTSLLMDMKRHAPENVKVVRTDDGYPAFMIPKSNFPKGDPLRAFTNERGYIQKKVYPASKNTN